MPVIKGVHIHFSQPGVIVAPLHRNLAGVLFEQTEVICIDGYPGALQLGEAFRDAFDRFSIRDKNLRDAKATEWPSFLASKLSSVKRFESLYRLMSCMSLNASNAVVRAAMAHPLENDIELALSFNPLLPPSTIGEQLLRLAAISSRP